MTQQNQSTALRSGRPRRLDVFRRLAVQVAELHDRMGGLPSPDEASGIWEDIWYAEAHHSTAIEGNTLVLKQVKSLLRDGKAVGDKELREYLEVKGYAQAASWVYQQAMNPSGFTRPESLLTLAELREIHYQAMTPVWEVAPHPNATDRERPGSFREHEIQPFPGGMTPVTFPLVHSEIDTWIDAVNSLNTSPLSFPEELAKIHCRFEQIHPFLDGNGRAGRLILNLILVRLGYPPMVIYKRDRDKYLTALSRADDGDPRPLGQIIARAILDSLNRFVFPAVAGPGRLVPLTSLEDSEINTAALRAAAVRGRLRATRGEDGLWRSTRQWVEEYKQTRWQRQ